MEQASSRESGILAYVDREVVETLRDFQDPSPEWRRLFSELLGTFFLVLGCAGTRTRGFANPRRASHARERCREEWSS